MVKLSSIDKNTINVAVKSGFTFSSDAHFIGFFSAKRCLNRLVRLGYLLKVSAHGGTEYVPTSKARDFIEYKGALI